MNEVITNVNWLAVFIGALVAFGLGALWFSPKMFGKIWSTGTHNIQPPASPPFGAMLVQFSGTFLFSWLVGVTATNEALLTILIAIIGFTLLLVANGMFGQKSRGAYLVDGGYVIASGAIMILCQGII